MKNSESIKLFTHNAIAARLWFWVSLVLLTLLVFQPFFIIQAYRTRERVVILDEAGTFSISHLLDFEEAKALHENIALLAAQALLSQNPEGFDFPDLLERIFLKEAHQKAKQEIARVQEELEQKNIYQKQQSLKIQILGTRNNVIMALVSGELIRCGLFADRNFSESIPFALNLTLVRNPNMLSNKRYPLAVHDFELKQGGNYGS